MGWGGDFALRCLAISAVYSRTIPYRRWRGAGNVSLGLSTARGRLVIGVPPPQHPQLTTRTKREHTRLRRETLGFPLFVYRAAPRSGETVEGFPLFVGGEARV